MSVPSITPPVERFHRVLIDEIARKRPDYLERSFTVAEIYQSLVPYRSHRDAIGVQMNGDYEDALLRLLAGAGDLLILESGPALGEIRRELESRNPNTGLFREFASAEVRLNMTRLPEDVQAPEPAAVAPAPVMAAQSEEAPPASVGAADAPAAPIDTPPEAARPSGGNGLASQFLEAEIAPVLEAAPPPVTETHPAEAAPTSAEDRSHPSSTSGCLWCSESLPDRNVVNFCPFCGQSTQIKPCGGCGETMELGWRFCVTCGAESKVGSRP